eukprot:5039421-Amphidinium_carterae.1
MKQRPQHPRAAIGTGRGSHSACSKASAYFAGPAGSAEQILGYGELGTKLGHLACEEAGSRRCCGWRWSAAGCDGYYAKRPIYTKKGVAYEWPTLVHSITRVALVLYAWRPNLREARAH